MEVKEVSLEEIMKINSLVSEFQSETKEEFEERLLGKKSYLLGAYIDEEKAGYLVAYELGEKEGYIWMAGTIDKHRQKGVMKALMDYFESKAKEQGYVKIKIKTRNTRRAQIINLTKRNYMLTKVEEKENQPIKENRLYLEKVL